MYRNITEVINVIMLCINETATTDFENDHIKNKKNGYPGVLISNNGILKSSMSKATTKYEGVSNEIPVTG